ncbi:F0F1 ATP synthase subunit delta [Pseudoalteromonas sp. SS15]|jgi:F-type H+-transporting ATPase subunit delta|uniref:ATP synthase subunit delta n=1 Tax=Pseudoalteromonas phenolica TaxID=161398 RepID=A0A0S2K5S2_9GAMM|nr:F0F1 ATP synthase subunit delta [Pseudoalteromonas phenolica]ALO43847.1 ATP synthase subunit delta [Pseudoalteromonas phenolica]MBE0354976.1 F-type H+-transporting ATPase subunit delta [Pseudoalteromonas phenolica O-BC30]RXF04794.1 F0F1 ATP synthase subunit delta [Pseudoalteromonas phenolica O-BC30]TMN87279.1 F0F1 ATP synthase subunit delta [Pseudoalteromonas phenolica]TMO54327.1 F0F1 ATP synthase subunit delta [Pseudoalteromonas phenolica]|tara:strand:- start:36 stop:569 length:534 start_codon:yes stop_codon:yes gene_type:complete
MSELTTIARPYAKAAFELAVEKGNVEAWNEMLFFAGQVASDEQASSLLASIPTAAEQADVFIKVCAEQLNEQGQNLIKLMAENERLAAIPAVAEIFAEFKAEFDKEIDVDVVSATELAAEQQDKLVAALEKRFARKVKLNCSIDETVVGGLVIKAGDTVIDGSVRGKLDRLAVSLQS